MLSLRNSSICIQLVVHFSPEEKTNFISTLHFIYECTKRDTAHFTFICLKKPHATYRVRTKFNVNLGMNS